MIEERIKIGLFPIIYPLMMQSLFGESHRLPRLEGYVARYDRAPDCPRQSGRRLAVGTFGRGRRSNNRRVNNGAGLERHTAFLQQPPHFGEQLLSELMLFQQVANCSRHCFAPQVDASEVS